MAQMAPRRVAAGITCIVAMRLRDTNAGALTRSERKAARSLAPTSLRPEHLHIP
ncbi:hypothetical protein TGAM01_v207966 [Trichoderma gamsii]|uniref:Uncharacterized protein n=1 Tax=Trichoderma gamsii TaxID=398673 RepID=A0A2P4ZFZ8_9HYPO|nr:hypothetical protein TGAM01_v207966 [Trichoderma gamsii]PON23193.1 hypothetical protein TGAM01_v207966 [Trichoderma gamsii]